MFFEKEKNMKLVMKSGGNVRHEVETKNNEMRKQKKLNVSKKNMKLTMNILEKMEQTALK